MMSRPRITSTAIFKYLAILTCLILRYPASYFANAVVDTMWAQQIQYNTLVFLLTI